jgi:hypothetical protein
VNNFTIIWFVKKICQIPFLLSTLRFMQWINWRELESNIPLEQLPEFHRAFLQSRGIANPETMPLRRVQQSVERELNTLIKEEQAKLEQDILLVLNQHIPQPWLEKNS